MDYTTALLITATFIVLYTVIGGFLAVSWTDTIQGMMMMLAIAILPWIAINVMGGWSYVAVAVPAEHFSMFADGQGGRISAISIISDMAWGLGYFGMPHILVRFMAIKSEPAVRRSAFIAIGWTTIALSSAVLVGIVGFAFTPGLANSETVFIQIIDRLFMAPGAFIAAPILGGLFLCGIFAAIKSTADSQLLVASSSITGDIYNALINKKASDRHLVWFSRISVLAVAVFAFFFALDPDAGVMALVANAWAGFGAAFGPLVILSLFWRRTNRVGATAGIIVGGLTVIIWEYIPFGGEVLGASTALYSLVPGFALSLIAIIVGSLATKPPSEEILAEFEAASKPLVENKV